MIIIIMYHLYVLDRSTHTAPHMCEKRLPAQLLTRAILGLYLWAACVAFRRAAAHKFGKDTGMLPFHFGEGMDEGRSWAFNHSFIHLSFTHVYTHTLTHKFK